MEKEGSRSSSKRPLVLVPWPVQSHITPIFQLGTMLHSQGFPIILALPRPSFSSLEKKSSHPDFIFHPLIDGKPDIVFRGLLDDLLRLERQCTAPLEDLLTQLIDKQLANKEELPCVIYDDFMFFAESVASKLKLPSFIFDVTLAAYMRAKFLYPQLIEDGYNPAKDSKLLVELVPGLHPVRFKDVLFDFQWGEDQLLQLFDKITNIRSSSALILNTMDFLENSSLSKLQQECRIPVFAVGPLHKSGPTPSFSLLEEDNRCITWLNNKPDHSVLFVSFGSFVSISKQELVEMAWGLANSKQPFLWVVRPDLVRGSKHDDDNPLLPKDFIQSVGERGCMVKWAPQKQVLAHKAVGGFWSQCGWNSTMESICEGVPMICTPSLADQRINTRYLSDVLGVGLELEMGFERGEVEKTVKRLLVDKEGELLRQRAADLKTMAELSFKEGGSSYNFMNKLVEFLMSA